MKQRTAVVLVVLVLALASSACQSPANQRGEILRTGMPIELALNNLREAGLHPNEIAMAIVRVDGRPFDMYVVDPSGGEDGFFLTAIQNRQGVKVVDSLYWWINWRTESELPKGLRKYEGENVEQIDLREIKDRLRGGR